MIDPARLARAVDARLHWAERLLDRIGQRTADTEGVTRPAWSREDQAACDALAEAAGSLDLDVGYDGAGNLRCRLPGRDPRAPALLTGSHVDSVPRGGNFDGLAGVVAGLTSLAALADCGLILPCDVVVLGLRGEESVWYGIAYVGSRLAVGALPLREIDRLRRGDTGRTLAEHMAEVGVDPDRLREPHPAPVTAENTRAFLELHIEQGPVLVADRRPAAIPTTIRGNVRYPYARCLGRYDHSAASPREHRQDAVLAVTDLVHRLEAHWHRAEAAGVPDTVFTVGKLFTDPGHHAMTKVPGRCDFTLNFGGTTGAFLAGCRAETERLAREIASARDVRFELGECVGSDPTPLDPTLREALSDAARRLAVPVREMATVGHDASIFARAGIPSAMVLVRNAEGSHNPHERMDMEDFGAGTRILALTLASLAR